MTRRVLVLFFLLAGTPVPLAFAQESTLPRGMSERLDRVIHTEMKKQGIPGLAAAIVRAEGIVWSGAYGVRDVETGDPTTTDTVFMIGSISKTVTAVAIMQLVERGEIDLDADVNDYLPFEIRHPKAPHTPITVRMLMNHRAGLVNPGASFPKFNRAWSGDEAPPIHPWIEQFFDPADTDMQRRIWQTRPGRKVSSSNLGVTVLGAIVQVVSGMDFSEYCRVNIFRPLGMTNSGFRNADTDATKVAAIYQGRQRLRPYSIACTPTGTARSSADELARYVSVMLGGGAIGDVRILRKETVDAMLTITYPRANLAFGAGVGLIWRSYGSKNQWIGHTGAITGASTCIDFDREKGVGVITLAAGRGRRTVYPGGRIYSALHREALRLADRSDSK